MLSKGRARFAAAACPAMATPHDFTRLPEAEEQPLLETGARLAGIVQSATDAIVVVDDRLRIVLFNAAAERMFGWPEQPLGSHVERFVAPRFRAAVAADFDRLRRTDTHVRSVGAFSTFAGLCANGDEFPCEASIAPYEVEGTREFAIFVRDITERTQSEETLRRRVEFETFLFDLSRTFIGLPEEKVDVNMEQGLARVGEFLRMDRVTLLELSPNRDEMIVAYSWTASGRPDLPSRISVRSQPWWVGQVLRGEVSLAAHVDDLPEEAATEKEYLRQRGVASAASIPLRVGGEIVGAISFVTTHRHESWTTELVNRLRAIGDILWNALKRRQAMQALLAAQGRTRDSEERFRLAMNNVAAGVYTLDLQGLVTYVNPAAEVMFGWTVAELLGKRMHDVTHHQHPDGTPFPGSDCPGLQVLQKGIELREQSDTFIRKDGTFFPVVYSASPLKRDGTTLGIVVGFRDDAQHREAERMMRESEERFRLIASTAPVIIWMSDADQQGTYINESWTTLTGLPQEAGLGQQWAEAVHPDDRERLGATYTQAFDRREPFHIEYRLRRHDDEFRWIFAQGVPRYDARGSFAGYIGSAVDVTERREAEELLSTLSQRLIEAQEQERSRLARELHDDINQRLAVLLLSLEIARKRQGSPTELREQLRVAIDTATSLASDVQSLSHRLHSSKLQTLGLERAAREVCREFSERSSLVIDFQSDDVATAVGEEVALCLYRVLQEALQNAVKHSGAPHIAVSLETDLNAIALTVQDSGIGFETGKAFRGRGLGLVSMKERLKLVNGQLSIETRSPGGTTIRARVPLNHSRRTAPGVGTGGVTSPDTLLSNRQP
jgi:PAS domain S-box-containing protein